MRLFGAICVMLAVSAFAYSLISNEKRALRCLGTLCCALERMRAELTTRLCPTQDLLHEAANTTEGETAQFFFQILEGMDSLTTKSFAELWQEAVETSFSLLPETEKNALITLGGSLGRYALEEQLSAIDRFLLVGQAAFQARRAALPDKRRLIVALCETAGIFLCLLLL